MLFNCSCENCSNIPVIGQMWAVLLGKDEASQQFVFRVWHTCPEHVLHYSRYSGEHLHQMEKHHYRSRFRMFFLVNSSHLALAKRLSITWYEEGNGAPGASMTRPYGNSDLLTDIAEIIGYPLPKDDEGYTDSEERYLEELHRDMHIVLQIILHTGQMKPGVYKKPNLTEDWVEVPHPRTEAELVLTDSDTDFPRPFYRLL